MYTTKDRKILQELALQVREISMDPIMETRKEQWRKHNSLQRIRPMVLIFPEGSWEELLPPSVMKCETEPARKIEKELRSRIYHHHHLHDDKPIEKTFTVGRKISHTGWGLAPRYDHSSTSKGAWAFHPVILDAKDLKKLKMPRVIYDETGSLQEYELVRDLFGDILDVELSGVKGISFHMMSDYCRLRGLEQVMVDMHENPEMIHEAMAFFEEGNLCYIRQLDEMNLFSLNNDGTYHSSGGLGYTDELPAPGHDPLHIRPIDMWSSAESQEMAQVSPRMHREFIMEYEIRLLDHFGLNGYGCCEDLTHKLDDVLRIPRLRRVSISPWSDVGKCAEKLGDRCIFSWKPQPAHLVGNFDENQIREYIRNAFELTRACIMEIILKDTHTCENRPQRFTIWSDIAKELAEQF